MASRKRYTLWIFLQGYRRCFGYNGTYSPVRIASALFVHSSQRYIVLFGFYGVSLLGRHFSIRTYDGQEKLERSFPIPEQHQTTMNEKTPLVHILMNEESVHPPKIHRHDRVRTIPNLAKKGKIGCKNSRFLLPSCRPVWYSTGKGSESNQKN